MVKVKVGQIWEVKKGSFNNEVDGAKLKVMMDYDNGHFRVEWLEGQDWVMHFHEDWFNKYCFLVEDKKKINGIPILEVKDGNLIWRT